MGSTRKTRQPITEDDVATLAASAPTSTTHDVAKMVQLRMRGNSLAKVGEIMGVHKTTVERVTTRFLNYLMNPEDLKRYRESKPDLFESTELKLLDFLNERLDDPTYKPPLKDIANAMKVVVELRRLETGQSTDNVAVFVKSIEQAHKNLFTTPTPAQEPAPDENRQADLHV
jgi:hypothetical protein